jgi:hypothetical protein
MYSYYIMNKYDMYITAIFVIKIGFILMAITHVYLEMKGKEKTDLDKKILFWKERFDFIFTALMSVLLIYIFNPRYNNFNLIDKETKVLFYLFGFVLIITAKWRIFFEQSPLLKISKLLLNKL